MPDPRALRIDVGPFHLAPTAEASTWTALPRGSSARPAVDPQGASGADAGAVASGITAGWSEWVAFAQRVLQADAQWRDLEARGDAWDEGFAASRDTAAVNPYR